MNAYDYADLKNLRYVREIEIEDDEKLGQFDYEQYYELSKPQKSQQPKSNPKTPPPDWRRDSKSPNHAPNPYEKMDPA